MSGKKRTSSPSREAGSVAKSNAAPAKIDRVQPTSEEGMGEFEDVYEDDFENEEEEGVVVDAAEEDAEIALDEDTPMDEEERPPSPVPFLPTGVLQEGEVLEPDLSTYPLLHEFKPTWPSLSFDFLRDHDGEQRRGYPVSCTLVSGTQAQDKTANELTVMRWEGLGKTDKGDLDSDEESDDDDIEDDPVLTFKTIPHQGCINRIRARPVSSSYAQGPPLPPLPYHVATFSETGKVHIFDVAPQLDALLRPAVASAPLQKTPVHTIAAHGRAEGYALDWDNPIGETPSSRLLSGDVHAKIYMTTINQASFTTAPRPFLSHTDSVEDLQWSPSESTVFASCSADKSIRIWDIRTKDKKSVIGLSGAHEGDVNVISWNKLTNYLLASGGDEGGIKVWDLRNFKGVKSPKPTPVAYFDWHTAPITSIEWHPTDESSFAASGADNQITLWDLSVEQDDEDRNDKNDIMKDVPPQLLFVHQGQKDIKELHWNAQVPGVVVSTAYDGFNIFKTLPFSS